MLSPSASTRLPWAVSIPKRDPDFDAICAEDTSSLEEQRLRFIQACKSIPENKTGYFVEVMNVNPRWRRRKYINGRISESPSAAYGPKAVKKPFFDTW